jgi:hypothetical protein
MMEHSTGGAFTTVASPNARGNNYPFDVDALSTSDAWAVGTHHYSHDDHSLAMHWNGLTWSIAGTPSPSPKSELKGVVDLSPTNAWAVGRGTTTKDAPLIEHWNGTKWVIVAAPHVQGANFVTLEGVGAVDANNIWAAGFAEVGHGIKPVIDHWNGTSWKKSPAPAGLPSKTYLTSIGATSSTSVYAGGYSQVSGHSQAFVLYSNGTSWTSEAMATPGTSSLILGVGAIPGGSQGVVGTRDGVATVLHYNGPDWAEYFTGSASTTFFAAADYPGSAGLIAVGYAGSTPYAVALTC